MGVQFYHPPSQRQFPARTVDISRTGTLMYVPATAPVQVGHAVRVNIPSIPHPEFAGIGPNPIDATVVRVDRKSLLPLGHVTVGIRFAEV
jgi:hypothetical protein